MTVPRKCHITEIIDIEALGELFQHLSNVTDIPTAVLDLDGNILIATKWQDICTNFHRINPLLSHKFTTGLTVCFAYCFYALEA